MKIKELMYEWVLFWANFLNLKIKKGFYDKNKVYERKNFLNWDIKLIRNYSKEKELVGK